VQFEYKLLWILLVSNLMAIVLQTLAARLGLVTGKDLAHQCRNYYPKWISYILWILAELAIIATDLAEVMGTAIALKILFKLPMIWGVLITVADTMLLLVFEYLGSRIIEGAIFILMSIITGCFVFEMFAVKPSFVGILSGFIPSLPSGSLSIAVGILGATIMPHNIYLHSGVVLERRSKSKYVTNANVKYALIDGILSLNIAFFVNASILITAAAFYSKPEKPDSIESAYKLLELVFGKAASIVFGIALLCSGQSSTITGTIAGGIVMEGFINMRMRSWVRRLITRTIAIIPAAVVLLLVGDASATQLLVWSQVVLSIQLPFAIIPLIRITSQDAMGVWVNRWYVKVLGWFCCLIVVALNVWLLVDQVIENWSIVHWIVWLLAGVFAIIWIAFVIVITFIPITPKEPEIDSIENNLSTEDITDENVHGIHPVETVIVVPIEAPEEIIE
jgi:manganese transport protein